jgi:hypothetical protein
MLGKNKPRGGDSEHVFILGPYTVRLRTLLIQRVYSPLYEYPCPSSPKCEHPLPLYMNLA